jgi:uncharacterized protein YdaU (DUF1376 family)
MSAPQWMKFYVGDYLRDTRGLSTLEHGAYLLLIMEYWSNGGLPSDERKLARITGLSAEEWDEVRPTLVEFFYDGWRHKRIDHELSEAEKKSNKAKAAAEKGWGDRRKAGVDADAMRSHSGRNADAMLPEPEPELDNNQETDNRNIRPKPAKPVRTSKSYPEDFEEFWKLYPTDRIMSKALAAKEWARLSPDDRRAATASIPGFLEYCRRTPTYRAVHACRYLSQRRFDAASLPIPPPVRPDAQDGRRFVPAI